MKKIFYFLLFIGIFGSQALYSQYTDVINSNRPGESHGAFSVGRTIFQTEGGLSYINEKHTNTNADIEGFFVDLDIRYGFWREELEFIADLQYRTDSYKTDFESINRNALKTSTLGFKYLVYDPFKNYEEKRSIYSWKANHKFKWRQFVPAVAVYAGANLNLSDNPYLPVDEPTITPKVMIALQNHFTGGWVFVTNIFADRITTDYMTFGGILTVTKSFNEKWSGFAEIQGYKSDYINDFVFRGGAAYLLNEDLQLDISVGKNFHNTRDVIYGGIGVSWRFTMNYKDIILYRDIPKEGNKNKKEAEGKVEEIQTAPELPTE